MRDQKMNHVLFASIDEMLAPETLSELEGRAVKYVHCRPFNTRFSRSGSSLLVVETNDGQAVDRYVLKRVSLEYDWIMRVTEDYQCRSMTLWQSGLLDKLKPAIEHGIVACSRDGAGWAILMRDLTTALLSTRQLPNTADNERILDAMAAMHAAYWDAPELANPALGLCRLCSAFHSFSPERVRQELNSEYIGVRALMEGWELLFTQVEPKMADTLHQLITDPQPLCVALARCPQTLIHGDLQLSNLGIDRTQFSRTIMLDWQFAAMAPPTIDLCWYVGTLCWYVGTGEITSVMREASIAYYRRRLATYLGEQYEESDWQCMLALGSLAHLLRSGGWSAYNAAHAKGEDSRINYRSYMSYLLESVQTALQWL
jgi:hypothetical protein